MKMKAGRCFYQLVIVLLSGIVKIDARNDLDVTALRNEAHKMFMHGYNSYMNYAFPADELMPLSCKGRVRGVTPSRGDVDDSLGNFSLTLLDTLDTLVVMNEFDEFERSVELVIKHVRFDSDLIVSVFETNIRVLGGLISAHVMANVVKDKFPDRLKFYDNQLLKMAKEVGDRLLPAFNTTSGLPFSRINLKYGMLDHLKRQKDTCTACGGTMLLEMAALSRLTGDDVYETKARKAMDFLWQQRHRSSDLMGTVLNVHSGDWVRRESGIGAGIDSYYEYCLKAYILLGDDSYLERFNKHYEAIMRYVNKGPLFVDVHMHRPTVATRGFMDSLLAFWPGLQVLKGDVKEAIEMHEMLFQVIQKHKFLPEAFTHDFQVHWAEHPLRPEFVESTYFLYRATKDPHYLYVAKQIMDTINQYVKVPCGFASLKDVRTMIKEDQMESFVLSETFKYLYMIFADANDMIFDPDHFVLTTEAHFLPLSMGSTSIDIPRRMILRADEFEKKIHVCANPLDFTKLPTEREEAQLIRERTKIFLGELKHLHNTAQAATTGCDSPTERLRAWEFTATNSEHTKQLSNMGIDLVTMEDGRLHLSHQAINAVNPILARWGNDFMQEMMQYVAKMEKEEAKVDRSDRYVQLVTFPQLGKPIFLASPAQFGFDLTEKPLAGKIMRTIPWRACSPILNYYQIAGKIAIVERSDCMFQEKARNVQRAGAIGMIVIDNQMNPDFVENRTAFAMAGDKDSEDDIAIPSLFIFRKEGEVILAEMRRNPNAILLMTSEAYQSDSLVRQFLINGEDRRLEIDQQCPLAAGNFVSLDRKGPAIHFNFRFGGVKQDSTAEEHHEIVERHITEFQKFLHFDDIEGSYKFYELVRTAAYGTLGLNIKHETLKNVQFATKTLTIRNSPTSVQQRLRGVITRVRCLPNNEKVICTKIAD